MREGIHRYGLIGSFARYLLMLDEFRKFVQRAHSDGETAFRRMLLNKFNLIHMRVPCGHSPFQFVLMAEYILNLNVPGPIVECGCYKGGSTAKLSLLAKETKRSLYVFDSFQGLPEPESEEERMLAGHGDNPSFLLSAGDYKSSLDEVKENVAEYGCIEVCEFIPGFFSESLKEVTIKPAFVFIDVDFVSSARDCLRHLWPHLVPNGLWFTHEAVYQNYVSEILDATWWHEALAEFPPIIWGAGSGLSILAPSIAYFQKSPQKTGNKK